MLALNDGFYPKNGIPMFNKTVDSMRGFYRLMTSDLSMAEIERLIKVDTREMYEYYLRSTERPVGSGARWKRFVLFVKNMFITFLLKLTPARRFLYFIAICLFALFLFQRDWQVALYAFVIVNFLLALELADKLVARDELSVAREIQLSLLPQITRPIAGFEIATFSDAAKSVGGDYFDFINLPDGSTVAVIADISGKGMSAALYMVKVQTMLQTYAREARSIQDLLIRLNDQLYCQFKRNYFLTMTLLVIHADGLIQICRAGHTPALYYDSDENRCLWIAPKGMAIGMVPSSRWVAPNPITTTPRLIISSQQRQRMFFNDLLEIDSRRVDQGDILLLYTDGVSETFNERYQEFGDERLVDILNRYRNASPGALKEIILQEFAFFRGSGELRDDITFMVMRRGI